MAVYFAFPGMGKTPLAKHENNFIDLDFGHFRTAFGVTKQAEGKLLPHFARLICAYLNEGWTVLTNEPKLVRYLRRDSVSVRNMKFFLPGEDVSYSAEKLNMDLDEVKAAIMGWEAIARANHIPVVRVQHGLDHYLMSEGHE